VSELSAVSRPSRVADPDEGISLEELGLAARNHAMPAEALRYDVTPAGLHYVLTHYDIPDADPATWTVSVGGLVERPLRLSLDDLAAMTQHSVRVTLECAGNGRAADHPRPVSQPWLDGAVGTADWSGVRLADVLSAAGLGDPAVSVVFAGADHGVERGIEQDYERGLTLAEAATGDALVATSMNGAPLPPQHGFPVRLVVPGWYGMASVKWLREIRVVDHEFDGYQHHAYRIRQSPEDPGVPVTRIEPRALLEPPGFPDFMSRARVVDAGPVVLRGRAWSGWGPVERVEVSSDDGATWVEAALGTDHGPYAWRAFSAPWTATPGGAALRARATDATGRVQPTAQAWNRGGFSNNASLPIPVLVR
jgi:DMSO/TMAO reductase YedYZ molybdopterin-dependent catalytic subunit